jgi:hypothetical protein
MDTLRAHLVDQERCYRQALLSKLQRYARLPGVLTILTLEYHLRGDLQETVSVKIKCSEFQELRLWGEYIVLQQRKGIQVYDLKGKRIGRCKRRFIEKNQDANWGWDGTLIKKASILALTQSALEWPYSRAHMSNINLYVRDRFNGCLRISVQSNSTQKVLRKLPVGQYPISEKWTKIHTFSHETDGLLVMRTGDNARQFYFYDFATILPDMAFKPNFPSSRYVRSFALVGRNLLFILLDDRSCYKLCLTTKSLEKTQWVFDHIASNSTHLVGVLQDPCKTHENLALTILKFG